MNDDSEVFQRSLLKLLQGLFASPATDTEANNQYQGQYSEANQLHHPDAAHLNTPVDARSGTSEHDDLEDGTSLGEFLIKFGEVPAVQDRFHALLKHRLKSEIQHHPPLFPWETEMLDYEEEPFTTAVRADLVSPGASTLKQLPTQSWLNQLRRLSLPVAVPDAVLTHLLEQCQLVVQYSLKEGVKLVQAVEGLFPEQSQALNYLAGVVMTSPARSDAGVVLETDTDYPVAYESAAPTQQMVLSLLAAKEIIQTLTLTLSATQPIVERQWLTEQGPLTLQLEYTPQPTNRLRVEAKFPCASSLMLQEASMNETRSCATARRFDAGDLSVELFDLRFDRNYVLEVRLLEETQSSLSFAVHVV